jgi:hypothetical protein
MARPKKSGLDYFPHDVDASNDEKLEALEALYGAKGYAFYFKLLERIYRHGGELNVGDEETRMILAKKCLCELSEWEKMLCFALKIGLFDDIKYFENNLLTSAGIESRCEKVKSVREKVAFKYKKQVSARETTQETPIETQEKPDKGKESKVKERKEEILSPAVERSRNPIWDCIVELFEFKPPHPPTEATRIGRVCSFLKKKNATCDEIRDRFAKAKKNWGGNFSFGPEALTKWWDQLEKMEAKNGFNSKPYPKSRSERLDEQATDLLRELRGETAGNPAPNQQSVFVSESRKAG